MGGNRRYDMLGRDVGRMQDAWKRRPSPIGLTENQLAGTGQRVDAGAPVNVTAWIPLRVTYDDPQLIDGRAIA